MLPRDKKVTEERPCCYLEYNRKKARWEPCAPSVDCSYDCQSCDWNPKEHERRMEEGEWVYRPDGVRYLLFRSAKANATA